MSKLTTSLAVTTGVAALLLLGGRPATAHATTWHAGVPSALRGIWQRTAYAGTGKNRFSFKTGIYLTRRHFTAFGLGDPFVLNHLKYHKVRHNVYAVKGVEYLYSHKVNHIQLVKTGHRLKYKITLPKAYRSGYSPAYPKH